MRLYLMLPGALLLCGCGDPGSLALGTIERDHIELPAPVAERILHIAVQEGQSVATGDLLLQLDDTALRAQVDAAHAEARRLQQLLDETRHGPRQEEITRARAEVGAAAAQARHTRSERERVEALVRRDLLPANQGDAAQAADESAQAVLRGRRAGLEQLERGARPEVLAQAEAALDAAQAREAALRVELERTRLVAPRDGVVDSLPYEEGDQRPAGTPLVTLVTGDPPHARVYLPQSLRARVAVGDAVQVQVTGEAQPREGRVRWVRSTPSFTPYYALHGDDASRLVWLAEIELGADAARLADGMPVSVWPAAEAAR